MYPKVVGLIQANNEWPLLAVSISHALQHHIDEVYLLLHKSTDGSREGILRLKALWTDRIHVIELNTVEFWQEASTNALLQIIQKSSPDWIYVFDADEFLLTKDGKSLKEIISDLDPEYEAIIYDINNWVSSSNFDETNLTQYQDLCYRSVPNLFVDLTPEISVDEIEAENINFYDLPFPSKVIFKNNDAIWLSAGSHSIKSPPGLNMVHLDAKEIAAVHFPFLTKDRLLAKATQGERLIHAGFPKWHGWQSQMIFSMQRAGKLDRFWSSHSIDSQGDHNAGVSPSFVIDDSFANTIVPVISLLKDGLSTEILKDIQLSDSGIQKFEDTLIPFSISVEIARKYQLLADSARITSDRLRADLDDATAQRDIIAAELEHLRSLHDSIKNHKLWKFVEPIWIIMREARQRKSSKKP